MSTQRQLTQRFYRLEAQVNYLNKALGELEAVKSSVDSTQEGLSKYQDDHNYLTNKLKRKTYKLELLNHVLTHTHN